AAWLDHHYPLALDNVTTRQSGCRATEQGAVPPASGRVQRPLKGPGWRFSANARVPVGETDTGPSVRLRRDQNADARACWRHRGTRDRPIDGGLRNDQGPSSDLADQRQGRFNNARAAFLISEAVPADLLMIRAPAPDWFRWATSRPHQSQFVTVAGCRIHYLVWARAIARPLWTPTLRPSGRET